MAAAFGCIDLRSWNQGNRILIGLSFRKGRNALFLVLVNSGLCEASRLKDAVKN